MILSKRCKHDSYTIYGNIILIFDMLNLPSAKIFIKYMHT